MSRRGWMATVLVAVVAAAGAAPSLRNQFAVDDVAIIVENPLVTGGQPISRFFRQPYWPPPAVDGQYRPITMAGFGLAWRWGGGSPVVFHAVSVGLTCLLAVAFLGLAALHLPLPAALAAALVFAVHPVHSEAVANLVGQAELHCTLAAVAALWVYLRARRAGRVDWRATLVLIALAAWGVLGKEQGVVLPATLVLAEWLLVPRAAGASRLRAAGPALVLVAATLALLWIVRGDVAGSSAGPIAWPWRGLAATDRVLTVLGLLPEYVRLLVWPWHLRIDHNPPAFPVAHTWAGARRSVS